MKNKIRRANLSLGQYVGEFYILVGENQETNDYLGKEFPNVRFDLSLADAYCFIDLGKKYCIWLRGKVKPLRNGALTHEIVHLSNAILHESGWRYSAINDEPMAYFAAYLCEQIRMAVKEL